VFVSAGQEVVAEYEDGALARKYILGKAIDQPIAMISGGSTYYFARQRNGSIHALMSRTGVVLERYEYTATGKRTVREPGGAVLPSSLYGNSYGFTGRYHDSVSGLIDFRARQYSPELGRFISRDSAYFSGLSLYQAYFLPTGIDPSGHWNPISAVVDVGKTVVNGTVDVGKTVVNGAVDVGKTVVNGAVSTTVAAVSATINAATQVAQTTAAVAGTVINATVDGAQFVLDSSVAAAAAIASTATAGVQFIASTAQTVGSMAYNAGKWTTDTVVDVAKWAGQQAVNVGKGIARETWALSSTALSKSWDVVKATGNLGYWLLVHGTNPLDFISDPKAWLLGGLSLIKTTGSLALWTAFELGPTLMGSMNTFGPITLLGMAIGIAGWIGGGDTPQLNWAGGGLVFEFGHFPWGGDYSRTLGRTILYDGDPAEDRSHEFQHVVQYDLLGDAGYAVGQLGSQGISYLATDSYNDANLLEAGPYKWWGGPQRPWPWPI
jgi:RHS repeat-associated protein